MRGDVVCPKSVLRAPLERSVVCTTIRTRVGKRKRIPVCVVVMNHMHKETWFACASKESCDIGPPYTETGGTLEKKTGHTFRGY